MFFQDRSEVVRDVDLFARVGVDGDVDGFDGAHQLVRLAIDAIVHCKRGLPYFFYAQVDVQFIADIKRGEVVRLGVDDDEGEVAFVENGIEGKSFGGDEVF